MHPDWSGDGNEFTAAERSKLLILHNKFYRHKVMRVNYTTYDVRQGQDSLNPRTHSDIMILARDGDSAHPFDYARIVGIFHVDIVHNVPGASATPVSKEVLWVRWFRHDSRYQAGFKRKRLHRVRFVSATDPNAFGFLNPDEVIRGAHLIPSFYYGGTEELLKSPSIARPGEVDDWRYFYVNMYVFALLLHVITGG